MRSAEVETFIGFGFAGARYSGICINVFRGGPFAGLPCGLPDWMRVADFAACIPGQHGPVFGGRLARPLRWKPG